MTSATRNVQPGGADAVASETKASEESMPMTSAPEKVPASMAEVCPGPQPRSRTTRRRAGGSSARRERLVGPKTEASTSSRLDATAVSPKAYEPRCPLSPAEGSATEARDYGATRVGNPRVAPSRP